MKQQFILAHDLARSRAIQAVKDAPEGYVVEIKEKTRSTDQNAAQWPYLEGFSKQLQWPVNGVLTWLTPEEYKDILTAAFEGETTPRLASGFDGGVVMLGRRTSQYGKKRFSEWYEWLMAAAALKGITPVYKSEPKNSESVAA
ncbi:MAG: recombination protein NinB [Bradyrhizobium sp.]|nr:recombination protein NinB [Bradyrhizobium sp.]